MCDAAIIEVFLRRVSSACRENRVQVSLSAQQDAAEIGFDRPMIESVLLRLASSDFEKRVSGARNVDEWVWVFVPAVDDLVLWVRLIERAGVVVVSFHEV